MEDNGDYVLMKDIEDLIRLKMRMASALNRSDRDDFNNNSIMAAQGLDDYHRLQEEHNHLARRVEKSVKKMPEEKVIEMFRIAREKLEHVFW